MKASKLVHKILKFINYANLCKFTEPRKGPGCAIGFFIYLFFYLFFLLFRKLYHMKFAIFDVARCRMSATSLTFLLNLLHEWPFYQVVAESHWMDI